MVDKSQEAAFENFENLYEALKVLDKFKTELKDAKQKLLNFLKGNDLYFRDYCFCERGCKNDEARRCLERNGIDEAEFLFEESCGKELGELGMFFYDETLSKKVFNSSNFRINLVIEGDQAKQAFEALNLGIFEASLLRLSRLVREYDDNFRCEKELNFENKGGLERIEKEINQTLIQLKTSDEIGSALNQK